MRVFPTLGVATILAFSVVAVPSTAGAGWRGAPQERPKPQEKQPDKAKKTEPEKQQTKPRDEQSGKTPATQRGQQPAGATERQRPSGERTQGQPVERGRVEPRGEERGRAQAEPQHAMPRPPDKYAHEARTEQQARAWQDHRGWQRPDAWPEHATWRQHRARNWSRDHRTWLQRGGYGGFYIPADQFRLHFGVGHLFRLHTRPIIVMGYPRFQYGGYWFMLVDPWPESWAWDWYATDDLYIDYDAGYYLYNRRHPGIAIAISVVL